VFKKTNRPAGKSTGQIHQYRQSIAIKIEVSGSTKTARNVSTKTVGSVKATMSRSEQIRELALNELAGIAFSKPIIKGGPLFKTESGMVIYKQEKLKAIHTLIKATQHNRRSG
jgi:hypothetical protein